MLIPNEFLEYLEEVAQNGALKYPADNWIKVGTTVDKETNFCCMQRHLAEAYTDRIPLCDVGSGIHPLARVAWRALAELYRIKHGINIPHKTTVNIKNINSAKLPKGYDK